MTIDSTKLTQRPSTLDESLAGLQAVVTDLHRVSDLMDRPDEAVDGSTPREALNTAILVLKIIHSDLQA